MSKTETTERVIPCLRCHQSCGWCSDYRWMHGLMPMLPGTRKRCKIEGMAPEGKDCPMCHGSRKVRAITTYEAVAA